MGDPIRIFGLFAGAGGLERGVRCALDGLGISHRTVALAEWESRAARSLMEWLVAEGMGDVPVFLDDIRHLDGRELRGEVDLLCGGFPCQPFSSAGRQLGLDDERGWGDGNGPLYHLVRLIDEVRPGVVFLENVPGVLKHFEPVWRLVRGLGYEWARPLTLAAKDVGANHVRKRVWLLAYDRSQRAGQPWSTEARQPEQQSGGAVESCGRRGELAYDVCRGLAGGEKRDGIVGDCDGGGRGFESDAAEFAVGTHRGFGTLPLFAAARNDTRWFEIIDRFPCLAPALPPLAVLAARCAVRGEGDGGGDVEGEPGAAFPDLRELAHGMAALLRDRSDQLRIIGNGVVPAQAAIALLWLLRDAGLVGPLSDSRD